MLSMPRQIVDLPPKQPHTSGCHIAWNTQGSSPGGSIDREVVTSGEVAWAVFAELSSLGAATRRGKGLECFPSPSSPSRVWTWHGFGDMNLRE